MADEGQDKGQASRKDEPRKARARLPWVVGLASVLGLVVLIGLAWQYVVDDAFIILRYGRNLAAGWGLSWNPGEPPVEGYTSLLWVLLSAGLFAAEIEPMLWLKAFGCLCALGCVLLVYPLARRTGASPWLCALSCWLLALNSGFALWSVAGLETALQSLLLIGATLLFVRREPRTDLFAAVLLVLAGLCRFEAPLYAGALGVHRVVSQLKSGTRPRQVLRRNLPWAGLFIALYGAYFLFRVCTFGELLPNSVVVKMATRFRFDGSVSLCFLANWWPLLALGLGSLWARRPERSAVVLMPLAAVVIYLPANVYFMHTISSMSHLDRYFMPVWPMLVASSVAGLDALWKARRRVVRALAPALAAGLIAWTLFHPQISPSAISERAKTYAQLIAPRQIELGRLLKRRYGNSGRVALGDVGRVSLLYDGAILDLYGLNSRELTRVFDKDIHRFVAWVVEQRPDAIVLVFEDRHRMGDGGIHTQTKQAVANQLIETTDFSQRFRLVRLVYRDETPTYFYAVFEPL